MTDSTDLPPLPHLSPPAQSLLDDILGTKVLGASRNIRQINDLFCLAVEDRASASADELRATLRQLGDYFIATRGKNTPAIGNAIRWVLRGLDEASQVRDFIHARRDAFNQRSLENARRMAEAGAALFANMRTLLPFDYSSTMLAILQRMAEEGHACHLIVLESRVLDGGRPIAQEATRWGHTVTFVPDMAFDALLPQAEAVLIGAETLQADGGIWNTIGSRAIAALARPSNIPFYVATELIKIDPQSLGGHPRLIRPHDFSQLLGRETFDFRERISCVTPDLDLTPAELITAYITEYGVQTLTQMRESVAILMRELGLQALS